MSTTPKNTAGTAAASPLDRLAQLQRDLAQERARTRRAALMTFVLGIVGLVLAGGFFFFSFKYIASVKADELLAYLELEVINKKLPEGRLALERQIIQSAPDWAEELSSQALANVPTARQKLEEYALEQYDVSMKQVADLTETEFRSYIAKNRPLFDKLFKELADEKSQLSEAAINELEGSLEAELQTSMKTAAKEVLETLNAANTKMARLMADKDLDKEEQTERLALMEFKYIMWATLYPDKLERFSAPAPVVKKPAAKGDAKIQLPKSGLTAPGTKPQPMPVTPDKKDKDKGKTKDKDGK